MIDNKQPPPAEKTKAKSPQAQSRKAQNTPLFIIIAIAVLTPLASTLMFYLWQPSAATHKGEVITAQTTPAIFPPPSWQRADNGKRKDGKKGEGENNNDIDKWRGKWTLLQTTPSAQCDEECRRRLCRMRQLRLMLPGHYLRINRAWLINTPPANDTDNINNNNNAHNADNTNANITPPADNTNADITTAADNIMQTGDDNMTQTDGEGIGTTSLRASSDCGEIKAQTAAIKRAAKVDILNGVMIINGDNNHLPKASDNWQRDDYLYLIDPAGRMAMRFPPTITIYNIRQDLSRLLKLSRGWRQTK